MSFPENISGTKRNVNEVYNTTPLKSSTSAQAKTESDSKTSAARQVLGAIDINVPVQRNPKKAKKVILRRNLITDSAIFQVVTSFLMEMRPQRLVVPMQVVQNAWNKRNVYHGRTRVSMAQLFEGTFKNTKFTECQLINKWIGKDKIVDINIQSLLNLTLVCKTYRAFFEQVNLIEFNDVKEAIVRSKWIMFFQGSHQYNFTAYFQKAIDTYNNDILEKLFKNTTHDMQLSFFKGTQVGDKKYPTFIRTLKENIDMAPYTLPTLELLYQQLNSILENEDPDEFLKGYIGDKHLTVFDILTVENSFRSLVWLLNKIQKEKNRFIKTIYTTLMHEKGSDGFSFLCRAAHLARYQVIEGIYLAQPELLDAEDLVSAFIADRSGISVSAIGVDKLAQFFINHDIDFLSEKFFNFLRSHRSQLPKTFERLAVVYEDALLKGNLHLIDEIFFTVAPSVKWQKQLLGVKEGLPTFIRALVKGDTDEGRLAWDTLYVHLLSDLTSENPDPTFLQGDGISLFHCLVHRQAQSGLVWLFKVINREWEDDVVKVFEALMLEKDVDGHTFLYHAISRGLFHVVKAAFSYNFELFKHLIKGENLKNAICFPDYLKDYGSFRIFHCGIDQTLAFLLSENCIVIDGQFAIWLQQHAQYFEKSIQLIRGNLHPATEQAPLVSSLDFMPYPVHAEEDETDKNL